MPKSQPVSGEQFGIRLRRRDVYAQAQVCLGLSTGVISTSARRYRPRPFDAAFGLVAILSACCAPTATPSTYRFGAVSVFHTRFGRIRRAITERYAEVVSKACTAQLPVDLRAGKLIAGNAGIL